MWTEGNYRRIFLDMHIDDWNEAFLSRLDPEHIVEIMKEAHVQMLVVKSRPHTGLALFPTKFGRMHRGLKGRDYMKEMITLCHDNGIAVQAYFSQNFDNWAYKHHPDWRMINGEGMESLEEEHYSAESMFRKGRYGLVCPNNEDYRNYVRDCLVEMTRNYEFESIFLDMPFWPEVCYCPSCRKKYYEATGKEMPRIIDWGKKDFVEWQAMREEWMADFARFSASCVKSVRPEVTIEQNLSVMVSSWVYGSSELIADACDYAGGDLYGGYLEQSYMCKYYRNISKSMPFEYITSRCEPTLAYHTTTKSEEELKLYTMIALLHNGAISICDGMNPDGTIADRIYKKIIKNVFADSRKYEQYVGGDMKTDVSIWFPSRSKCSWSENGNPVAADHYNDQYIQNSLGMARILREENILFDVVPAKKIGELSSKLLVISNVVHIHDEEMEAIEQYLKKGGNVYISGHIGHERLYQLMEAEYAGMTEHDVTYMCPTECGREIFEGFDEVSPLNVQSRMERIDFSGEYEKLASISLPYTMTGTSQFASIHSNPPGIHTDAPAMICKKVGKGRILWSAAPIENSKPYMSRRAVGNVVRSFVQEPLLTSNAPACVEILEWEKNGRTYIAVINEQDASPFMPVYDIEITVPMKLNKVVLAGEEKELPIHVEGEKTTIKLPKLEMFFVMELYTI